MDRGMKKWIYWGAYVFLTLAGFLACIFRLLPVVTPSVFLLGLYNLCLLYTSCIQACLHNRKVWKSTN